jgi:hypothetical protein
VELLLIGMFLVVFLPLGVALFFVFATARKSRWGINLDAPSTKCPNCGDPTPTLRKPATTRQAMWGGLTCAHCGTEIDKWGRAVEHIAK